jgi:hypothetical protein
MVTEPKKQEPDIPPQKPRYSAGAEARGNPSRCPRERISAYAALRTCFAYLSFKNLLRLFEDGPFSRYAEATPVVV